MNSKWYYVLVGFNAAFALIGALSGSLFLAIIGFVFTIWNWFVGEERRKVELNEQQSNNNSEEDPNE